MVWLSLVSTFKLLIQLSVIVHHGTGAGVGVGSKTSLVKTFLKGGGGAESATGRNAASSRTSREPSQSKVLSCSIGGSEAKQRTGRRLGLDNIQDPVSCRENKSAGFDANVAPRLIVTEPQCTIGQCKSMKTPVWTSNCMR